MGLPETIDFDADPLEHWLPLRTKTDITTMPGLAGNIFAAQPDLCAILFEYDAWEGGELIAPTLPFSFWAENEGALQQMALTDLNGAALAAFGEVILDLRFHEKSAMLFGALTERCSFLMGAFDSRRVSSLIFRDLTFLMPSDIGDVHGDLGGVRVTSRRDLAQKMSRVIGEAWYQPAQSAHERLIQMRRIKAQLRNFDRIFLDLYGIGLLTTEDTTLSL